MAGGMSSLSKNRHPDVHAWQEIDSEGSAFRPAASNRRGPGSDKCTQTVRLLARSGRSSIDEGVALAEGLTGFFGPGALQDFPEDPAIVRLTFSNQNGVAVLAIDGACQSVTLSDVVIVAGPVGFAQTGHPLPGPGRWYLSGGLRLILLEILRRLDAPIDHPLYLRAKGLELFCETLEQLSAKALTPCAGSAALSAEDTRRILIARATIEDRLAEPLSLDHIARASGLNRTKLTRGFREVFGTTVMMFIIARRMETAKELLLTTELTINAIAFRSGYENGASFARAFARHFGVSASTMRALATI
jgi:AraC family transcriptional activator of pyochelin receptor